MKLHHQLFLSYVVGPNMEWKPKPTNPNLAQGSVAAASSESPAVAIEDNANLQPKSVSLDSKEVNVELEKKLEDLHISDGQYVIIPDHLHVPAAHKLGFSFGSFDTNFVINTSHNSTPESDQSALSESTDVNEEAIAEEQISRLLHSPLSLSLRLLRFHIYSTALKFSSPTIEANRIFMATVAYYPNILFCCSIVYLLSYPWYLNTPTSPY